ncbi:tetratricopeptide repeat protein [Sphingomicrobium nitratireducens]|uniref:tetratricopeptide repeat protein n=1 Tax=Sphingomicrobium nitratireducens TaxID=2964666 RepID=UPI0022405C15|nr:tetratricopeptide repeat protein [Sphingomicrobium nitratireducens]
MTRTFTLAASSLTALAVAACASDKIEIRQIASPIQQGDMAVADRLAEAAGQMRLGNIGLALESYRKALRTSPTSVGAHAGIARAYDQMGRFDLSMNHYQQALALRPDEPRLYRMLAASLKRQGRPVDAARVMAEAQTRAAALAAREEALATMASVEAETEAPAPMPAPVAEPEFDQAELTAERERVLAAAHARPDFAAEAIEAREALAAAEKALASLPERPVEFLGPPSRPELVAGSLAVVPEPLRASGVTVRLPAAAARPMPQRVAAPARVMANAPKAPGVRTKVVSGSLVTETVEFAPQRIAAPEPDLVAVAAPVAAPGPRLERLSGGEVALVTSADPIWQEPPVVTLASAPERPELPADRPLEIRSDKVALLDMPKVARPLLNPPALTRSAVEPAPVLLVAAGQSTRVAELAREHLDAQGLANVTIDRSPTARRHSILLYPKGRREEALVLARRFGFRIVAQPGPVTEMVLHLGSDAAGFDWQPAVRG